MNFNILCDLNIICNSHKLISSFYEKNNFIPCLTKQLLNVLKLWCEWGITLQLVVVVINSNTKFRDNSLKFTFHSI